MNPRPKNAPERASLRPPLPLASADALHVTLPQFWMGRDVAYRDELTREVARNAERTVERVNRLIAELTAAGVPLVARRDSASLVASGWRPAAVNAAVPAAVPDSPHIAGAACDLYDPGNALDAWCSSHLDVLYALGLWLEHPGYTEGWCHVQIVPPRCGNRVFRPW